MKNFAFETSRLYARSSRQVSSQLGSLRLVEDTSGDSYHGISDSSSLGFLAGLFSSSSESDPTDSLWFLVICLLRLEDWLIDSVVGCSLAGPTF